MVCIILVEGIMRNISVNSFEFGPVVHKNILFKDISLFRLASILFSEVECLCNFSRGCYKEHFEKLF